MKILESPLLGEFIAYLKANWSDHSRVDLRRRRLRLLIIKVRAVIEVAEGHCGAAVRDGSLAAWLAFLREEALRGQKVLADAARRDAAAVAGSTRRFLSGLRELVACSAEVDRLTEAVEELERLAGPGGDVDQFLELLRLKNDFPATAMEVDGGGGAAWAAQAQDKQEEESGSSEDSAALLVPGAKRKRARGSGVDDCRGSGIVGGLVSGVVGGGSASYGQVSSVVVRRKRRVLGWASPLNWLPTLSRLCSARRRRPPPASRSRRAPTAAVAWHLQRFRGRIGRPRRESIDQQLRRLSLSVGSGADPTPGFEMATR